METFYIPYQGGHLPMGVVSMSVQDIGMMPGELREVRMTIEAVSVGPPVYDEARVAEIMPPREVER
jgi:hypothetical protein